MPFVMFDQNVMKFMDEFYESGIAVKNYKEIMETAGVEDEQFDFVNLHILNEEVVCAILTYIIRADRFCEGVKLSALTVAKSLSLLPTKKLNSLYSLSTFKVKLPNVSLYVITPL